ncbi:F0F1 ATP synthase subunit alpha [Candidatus Woesebacteria bacterium]|jgi:F-type H+-transporting ATPase subunit alpha|nr:F0F1 ATP synthase subunit alpha [Candidatus Woesebacteria bacterium]MBP9687745.1 F0F1 ATP synthase subunit alpha [Candidatus Woesebacteria bacterium]
MFDEILARTKEVGVVREVRRNFILVQGLPHAVVNEIVVTEKGDFGFIFSLKEEYVEVVLLNQGQVRVHMRVVRTARTASVPVGKALLGRHIDPLGKALDGQAIVAEDARAIDIIPPLISSRMPIRLPFETGVAIVDALVPLGRGQRELVLGDRKTGKSSFLYQVLSHQARKGTICIYASVGRKHNDIGQFVEFVTKANILNQCVIVSSEASDAPGLIYLTPFSAMAIAEYYRDQGYHTLVIMDDLSTHAAAYREISLVARRFPGRSAYPGDVFYLHSRLMERAGNFNVGGKPVSITCLPVAQSMLGDITGYITTNLMSMTDGHIYFDNDLFDSGQRPAVNPFVSVTRVGLQATSGASRDLARELSSLLIAFKNLQDVSHFGAEISAEAQETLKIGKQLMVYFTQPLSITISKEVNEFILVHIMHGTWRTLGDDELPQVLRSILMKANSDQTYLSLVTNTVGHANTIADILSAQIPIS